MAVQSHWVRRQLKQRPSFERSRSGLLPQLKMMAVQSHRADGQWKRRLSFEQLELVLLPRSKTMAAQSHWASRQLGQQLSFALWRLAERQLMSERPPLRKMTAAKLRLEIRLWMQQQSSGQLTSAQR
jgi:hypothetical protein